MPQSVGLGGSGGVPGLSMSQSPKPRAPSSTRYSSKAEMCLGLEMIEPVLGFLPLSLGAPANAGAAARYRQGRRGDVTPSAIVRSHITLPY